MDQRELNIQLREKIRDLELKNQQLEKLALQRSDEFATIRDSLEIQVAERLEIIQQQEELKKLASLKRMAGAIAHRFNNAMMAVEGNLGLMTLRLATGSDEYKMASNALLAARGATQVGSMMLNYVGQRPLQLQDVSLADLVRESVTEFQSCTHHSVSLKFIPPDQPLYCSIDEQQIREVMESVLTNAVESLDGASETVEITFGTDYFTTDSLPIFFQDDNIKDGVYSFCQVKDSGKGINPENLAQIFEPFYTTKLVGRGLGLALTVGIMQKHHGAITVESTPERGTTIRVLFPSVSPPAQNTIVPCDDVAAGHVSLSGDILLADDEPIILVIVKMLLERLGFTVHTAKNGPEAVDKVRTMDVDFCAVILDILMPEMNGIESMKEIRKIDPAIPILLISGFSEEDVPLYEDKPDAFMVKPVQLSVLRSKLESLLA